MLRGPSHRGESGNMLGEGRPKSGTLRREGEGTGAAPDTGAGGQIDLDRHESHRGQPGACGRAGGGVGYGMIDDSR